MSLVLDFTMVKGHTGSTGMTGRLHAFAAGCAAQPVMEGNDIRAELNISRTRSYNFKSNLCATPIQGN